MSDSTVARLKRAVYRNRRFLREGLLERLFTLWFQGLVYTQIWEDPCVDAEALQLDDSSRVFTISSVGCNVLNYLAHEPEHVRAVDLNTAHLALARLKIEALRHLSDHDHFFQFFGGGEGAQNVEAYQERIRPHLDRTPRQFWDERPWAGLRRPRIHAFKCGSRGRASSSARPVPTRSSNRRCPPGCATGLPTSAPAPKLCTHRIGPQCTACFTSTCLQGGA